MSEKKKPITVEPVPDKAEAPVGALRRAKPAKKPPAEPSLSSLRRARARRGR